MGWEDRPYYRDRGNVGGTPLGFLLYGSVPLFTAFGIRVRAHASLLLFIGVFLLLGGLGSGGVVLKFRVESMTVLFAIVLLHEFGHCFACRWVGGHTDEIMMTPLGGLAMVNAPRRPLATFITVAAGPAVNVLICALAGLGTYLINRNVPWNALTNPIPGSNLGLVYDYLFYIYVVSLALLLFNLLPIFPLDGGQMLQSILWPKFGYFRSMMIACVTGIVGGIMLGLYGLSQGRFLLVLIAISGIATCVSMRRQLREIGPELEYAGDEMDFSASLKPDAPAKKRRRPSRWAVRRLRRLAQRDAAEQQQIDTILAKVSAHGMHSLTWSERRALKRATARQRKRELEPSREHR
jgi:Zn-dependent protease